MTCQATHHLVTQSKEGVLSLPKAHHVSALRQVELHPWLCALPQPTRVHLACRGGVVAAGLA